LESDINYGNSSRTSSSLLSAVNSARSSGVIYLGALSQNEGSNNTEATTELRLEVTYTVPPTQVSITAQNNFIYGTIKVGVNASATQRTSPHPFTATVGNTVNLEAQEQYYDGYYRIWNDTEAPLNPSKWVKIAFDGARTDKGTGISYSFTAADNDNNSSYEAQLRKICNINFQNQFTGVGNAGIIKINNQQYSLPVQTFQVVELNQITAEALNQAWNNINYTFTQWSDQNPNRSRTFYPNEHASYTAQFTGTPIPPSNLGITKTAGGVIIFYWTKYTNDNVTYSILRNVVQGSWSTGWMNIATVSSNTDYYQDNEYVYYTGSNACSLYYKIQANYSTENTNSMSDIVWTTGRDNEPSAKLKLELPTEYSISNFPNPFNPMTTFNYQLVDEASVTLDVFNIMGKKVAALVNGLKEAGYHSIQLNASDQNLSSGIYIYRFTAKPTNSKNVYIKTDQPHHRYVVAGKLILMK